MKGPKKKSFERVVGIATIISCIAGILGLLMNNILKIGTTKNDKTTPNDTIVISNLDTVFLQVPTPEKKIREDIKVSPDLSSPPHKISPESLNIDNRNREFTKFNEQQANEFFKFKEEQINEFNKFKEQNK